MPLPRATGGRASLNADVLWFVIPGVAAALLVVVFLSIGYWAGRKSRPGGLREIERTLEEYLAGRWDTETHVDPEAAAAHAARLLAELGRHLRDQILVRDRRAARMGQAVDAFSSRGLLLLDRDLIVVQASAGIGLLTGDRAVDLEGRRGESLFSSASWKEFLPFLIASRHNPAAGESRLVLANKDGAPSTVRVLAFPVQAPPEGWALWLEPAPEPESEPESEPDLEPVLQPVPLEETPKTLSGVKDVLDALADGVLVVAGGEIIEFNPAASRLLGDLPPGTRLKDLLDAEDLLLVLDRVARAGAGERVESVSCRLIPIAGSHRPAQVEMAAARIGEGSRPVVVLTLRDLTTEQRARRFAQLHEARLMTVLDAVADGLVLLAPLGTGRDAWRVSLANRRALDLLGMDGSAVLGAPEDEFLALVAHRFRDPAGFAAFCSRTSAEGTGPHGAILDMAGIPQRTLEALQCPVLDAAGEQVGRLLVLRDITHHRDMEKRLEADAAALHRSRETLQRAYEELGQVNRDLERKSTELDRLNRELLGLDQARSQLLADVSHELQTPLVSIRGYTQMILEGRLGRINDEQRRGLDVALRNVDRMVEMITNLLALARSESAAPLSMDPVDPGLVLAEIVDRHEAAAAQKSIKIETRGAIEAGTRVLAERDGFERMLDNLVSNAVKFNRPGGKVTISLRGGTGPFLVVEVSDTGVGIPAEEQSRVFDRFFRGRGAAGTPGTGIGLATVHNLVQRHGGQIEVDSAPGQGTTFRVHWPRVVPGSASGGAVAAF